MSNIQYIFALILSQQQLDLSNHYKWYANNNIRRHRSYDDSRSRIVTRFLKDFITNTCTTRKKALHLQSKIQCNHL